MRSQIKIAVAPAPRNNRVDDAARRGCADAPRQAVFGDRGRSSARNARLDSPWCNSLKTITEGRTSPELYSEGSIDPARRASPRPSAWGGQN